MPIIRGVIMPNNYPTGAFRSRRKLQQYFNQSKNKGKRSRQAVKLWAVRPRDPHENLGYIGEVTVNPPYITDGSSQERCISGYIKIKIPTTYFRNAAFPNENNEANFFASVSSLLNRDEPVFLFENFWFALAYYNKENPK